MKRADRHRSGFALFTMLVVLVLLGAFSLVATRLFVSTLRVTRTAQDGQTLVTRLDGMLRILRADVWNASQLEMADGQLLITQPGNGTIDWSIAEDRSIVRAEKTRAGLQEQRWTGLGIGLALESRGGMAVLRVQDAPSARSEEIVLVSQMMLAGRASQ